MVHEAAKQHLDNLITRQQDTTTDSSERMPKQLPKKWIVKLFSKFQVIYSHKWLSAIDTDELLGLAMQEWAERLEGLSGEQISLGLSKLKGEWPPTPHEFRELCEGSVIHKTRAYKPFQKLLPQKTDPEIGRKALSDIKFQMGAS